MNRSPRLLVVAIAVLLALGRPVAAQSDQDNPPVGWWRDATFYEVFVRSFADARHGPLAGDGIGDLQGAIDHLDYLNDGRGPAGHSLGINAVWLMPVQPSPSYHGYDVTDYFAVNPQYGDVPLMKRFVAEAHRRGIRVIVDFVLNHCSSEHPLFRAALSRAQTPAAVAARAMFRFADLPEQLYGPWGQRAWHPAGDEFYYGVFSPAMPDWNFRDPAVTEHHRRAAAFWLRDIGVDGFRLDAVRYFIETGDQLQDTEATRQWLHDFTAYCHSIKPGAFLVGENTSDMKEVAHWIRTDAPDSSFEFDLNRATLEAIHLQTPGILAEALKWLDGLYDGDTPWSTFLGNHDQDRILSQLDGDPAQMRFAAKLLFALPGVPFVYYGEEIGMTGRKPDPELRTPFPWTDATPNAGFTTAAARPWHPLTTDIARVNVAAELSNPNSLLSLYERLIRVNAGSPALRHGQRLPLQSPDRRVFATMRQTAGEAVVVLANFTAAVRPGPALTTAQSAVRPSWSVRELYDDVTVAAPDVNREGGFAQWVPVRELPPYAVYVIRLRR